MRTRSKSSIFSRKDFLKTLLTTTKASVTSMTYKLYGVPDPKDFYLGQTPAYPWGRVYGGQVVAQGLAAASATVDPSHRLHSVHAYFVLSGSPDQ